MAAKIISGKQVRDALIPGLRERVLKLKVTRNIIPGLSIIQVGNRPDSNAYIGVKKRFAEKIGVLCRHIKFGEEIGEEELLKTIEEQNKDENVHGIIVQLPLPSHINRDRVIQAIDPKKDADGLTGKCEKPTVIPATARGVYDLLTNYGIGLMGKKVCVVGRSILVGQPIAELCRKKGAEVVVCHSATKDLSSETKKAEILIVATGKAHLIGRDHVSQDQVVIDVGISKGLDGRIVGDVDFDNVKEIVGAISPVPGGVGPMTVCALFSNLLDLSE